LLLQLLPLTPLLPFKFAEITPLIAAAAGGGDHKRIEIRGSVFHQLLDCRIKVNYEMILLFLFFLLYEEILLLAFRW
jgi:hypothetical protein